MKVTRYLLYPCLLMAASASAQNAMTSSPYSMFGLGEMASGLYGQNTSMAGVTVGMREGMLMNIENPAGLTALDSCKLFAEASAFVKNERYRSDGSSSNAFTGNFSAFSLGGRIMRRWYMSAGVTPYSFVLARVGRISRHLCNQYVFGDRRTFQGFPLPRFFIDQASISRYES